MSSVRKKDQTPHRFTTLDVILDMYNHTTTVIENKKFDDQRYKSLVDRIDNEAAMVYHCCRAANEDYDNRVKEEAEMRIELQVEAIEHCRWLKTDIRLLQKRCHLREKKVIYWNGLINAAMEAIRAWHAAELRSYKENHGL